MQPLVMSAAMGLPGPRLLPARHAPSYLPTPLAVMALPMVATPVAMWTLWALPMLVLRPLSVVRTAAAAFRAALSVADGRSGHERGRPIPVSPPAAEAEAPLLPVVAPELPPALAGASAEATSRARAISQGLLQALISPLRWAPLSTRGYGVLV